LMIRVHIRHEIIELLLGVSTKHIRGARVFQSV
jgi:hypothetical protein